MLIVKKVAVEHTYEDKYYAINKLDGNMVLNMKLLEKPDNFGINLQVSIGKM